jgi:hypothetical protein
LLAVASPFRWPAAPDVPTFAESGLEDFKYGAWYGFAFPGGTPKPIIDKMYETLERVLARDDVRRSLEVAGTIATLSTPGDLRGIIEWDMKNCRKWPRNRVWSRNMRLGGGIVLSLMGRPGATGRASLRVRRGVAASRAGSVAVGT